MAILDNGHRIYLPERRVDIPIQDCREPLIPIPRDGRFAFFDPHPYASLGATYGDTPPYMVREWILRLLIHASKLLDEKHPWYRLKIMDGYRPVEVQAFMVRYVTEQICQRVYGLLLDRAPSSIRVQCEKEALELWARPEYSLAAPPPHSTGSVIDLTIEDSEWNELDMGSAIDEKIGAKPDHFLGQSDPSAQIYHHNRELLHEVMHKAGFIRLRDEWWHFSMGDQYAEWRRTHAHHEATGEIQITPARYGRWLQEYGILS